MSEGLLRQRRNLIIVCILLWLLKYGEINFTKVSFIGFDLTISNPDALILTLWIAFIYFLWRYFQYFFGDGLSRFISAFKSTQNKNCNKKIRELVVKKYPKLKGLNFEENYSSYEENNWKNQYVGKNEPHVNIEINPRELKKCKCYSYFYFFIINNAFSDYILPFVLALYVFIFYWGSYFWESIIFLFESIETNFHTFYSVLTSRKS